MRNIKTCEGSVEKFTSFKNNELNLNSGMQEDLLRTYITIFLFIVELFHCGTICDLPSDFSRKRMKRYETFLSHPYKTLQKPFQRF